jgi:hypothetical protein
MGAFYSKQPNGKYCRFSTVVDTLTEWNLTEEEAISRMFVYINEASQEEKELCKSLFEKRLVPFSRIKEQFTPSSNTIEEFEEILKDIGDTEGFSEEQMKNLKEWLDEIDEENN